MRKVAGNNLLFPSTAYVVQNVDNSAQSLESKAGIQ